MDIYRITRTDPKPTYGRLASKPEVRYGTRRRASAVAKQVRDDNESRQRNHERFPQFPYLPIQVTIERAPVTEWTNVTGEWFPAGEGL